MNQHRGGSHLLLVTFLVVAGVVLPLWTGCDVGCMAGDMACCESGPLPVVAAPCCPSPAEVTGRAVVATLADHELANAPVPVVARTGAGAGVQPLSEALPPPSAVPPRAPEVPLFLLHSVSLS